MDETFDPDRFIRRIGERLVDEFEDAKASTTPSTVGSAAEQPVREQLEQVLPRGVGVGEGCVIDSYGGTSRQQDVILYERDICRESTRTWDEQISTTRGCVSMADGARWSVRGKMALRAAPVCGPVATSP